MMFVRRKMELAPGAASRNVVFLLMPFVFAVDLQSGEVNDYEATWLHRIVLPAEVMKSCTWICYCSQGC
jgi:hypothetical protein